MSARSPDPTNPKNNQKDPVGSSKSDLGGTLLAETGLVHTPEKDVRGGSLDSSEPEQLTTPVRRLSSSDPDLEFGGLNHERCALLDKGLSAKVVNTLLESRKPVTQKNIRQSMEGVLVEDACRQY